MERGSPLHPLRAFHEQPGSKQLESSWLKRRQAFAESEVDGWIPREKARGRSAQKTNFPREALGPVWVSADPVDGD